MQRFIVKSDKGTPFYHVEDRHVTEVINKEGHWKSGAAYLYYEQALAIAISRNYALEM